MDIFQIVEQSEIIVKMLRVREKSTYIIVHTQEIMECYNPTYFFWSAGQSIWVTSYSLVAPEKLKGYPRSLFTARDHVFSDSVFCTGLGASDSVSATKIWNRWQKQSRTVPTAKTEMSLQVSRLTLDGTCVWVTHWRNHCTSYNTSCPKPGMSLRIDRQDHLRDHLQRHHQLGKSEGAKHINV